MAASFESNPSVGFARLAELLRRDQNLAPTRFSSPSLRIFWEVFETANEGGLLLEVVDDVDWAIQHARSRLIADQRLQLIALRDETKKSTVHELPLNILLRGSGGTAQNA